MKAIKNNLALTLLGVIVGSFLAYEIGLALINLFENNFYLNF